MLNQSDISADSQWATVQTQLSNLAAFSAVRSQEARQELFQDYVSNLQVPEQASQLKAAACMLATYRCCFQSQWTLMVPIHLDSTVCTLCKLVQVVTTCSLCYSQAATNTILTPAIRQAHTTAGRPCIIVLCLASY